MHTKTMIMLFAFLSVSRAHAVPRTSSGFSPAETEYRVGIVLRECRFAPGNPLSLSTQIVSTVSALVGSPPERIPGDAAKWFNLRMTNQSDEIGRTKEGRQYLKWVRLCDAIQKMVIREKLNRGTVVTDSDVRRLRDQMR